ncbi:MAG: HU family DNA-binding protein [Betaproteobacteria bacterium]|nr:HU family DNA-binding protein [Betaproteobacteria bacterium]
MAGHAYSGRHERRLRQGDRIENLGFGIFIAVHRPARVGRNPRSGEAVQIPEKRVPHFKPGKGMREAVDGGVGANANEV